jgi:leucyl/phenylalanyl-tRNA--protein transferase
VPDVQERARRSARSVFRSAVRPFAAAGMRCALKVVGPGTVGLWAARLASQPEQAAAEIARRVSSLAARTPAEVVGNYARGYLLFGRATGPLEPNGFEWSRFPRRAIITAETARVPKRLRTIQRRGELEVRYNTDFYEIIRHCRAQHGGGWITPELIDVYHEVYRRGFAGSVATYRDGQLAGGFWGVGVGGVLSIMSMFHLEDHAGALALAAVADSLSGGGPWSVIDCIELNPNFARYGFSEIPIQKFEELVLEGLRQGAGLMPRTASPRCGGEQHH